MAQTELSSQTMQRIAKAAVIAAAALAVPGWVCLLASAWLTNQLRGGVGTLMILPVVFAVFGAALWGAYTNAVGSEGKQSRPALIFTFFCTAFGIVGLGGLILVAGATMLFTALRDKV